MIHILLIVIGIVLIVVNRDIKNERADDGGSFANILKNEEKEFIVDSRSVFMRRMCDGGDSGRKSGKSRKRNRVRNGGRFRAISEKR